MPEEYVMPEEYMVDAYYGLVYSKDKAKEAEKYKTDDVRYLRRKTREVLAQSDANLIDTLYVHPIGNKCLGNCVYCMNESFNSKATVEKLSMDRYRNTLKYLVAKNYITDTVTISLTGGEPVLSDDLVNVLDISIEELEQVFSYVITTGMFYSDERFKYLMDISEDMRNKGIGRTLFFAAKEWAKQNGAKKLYISAHSAVESQAFYKAMGCVEAEVYHQKHVEDEPYDCQLECQLL